ncbi:hypothetical protein BDZ45DRAFT_685022 [Acephala macrosclerotiorum]|nr:hypothetical protein BDZ45DRAFT_685022 [Acephala macrosclerotiorum]
MAMISSTLLQSIVAALSLHLASMVPLSMRECLLSTPSSFTLEWARITSTPEGEGAGLPAQHAWCHATYDAYGLWSGDGAPSPYGNQGMTHSAGPSTAYRNGHNGEMSAPQSRNKIKISPTPPLHSST